MALRATSAMERLEAPWRSALPAHDWPAGGAGKPPMGRLGKAFNHDGSADVITGTQDIGGLGTRTGLAQIAAEELGLPIERVALRLGEHSQWPLFAHQRRQRVTQAMRLDLPCARRRRM